MNKSDMLLAGISIFNGVYSLATIENIFSIILLCFQVFLLIITCIIKIYKALKDKKLTKEEVDDIKESIDDINKTIDKIEDKKGGNKNE